MFAFANLEKASNRVPRKVVRRALRQPNSDDNV